jgi:methionyl-tRNA formyltransferase
VLFRSTGISVFQLEKGMDTGPLYSKRSIAIQPQWRSVELLQALSLEGPLAVHDALTMITAGQLPSAQEGEPSMAPKISKQDAQLNFSEDAQTLVNKVRAFTYEPGAWCNWKEEPFKITSATALEDRELKSGVITIEGQRVIVGCGDKTAIEFLTVIPAGKKEMNAADWARGARLSGGENFG